MTYWLINSVFLAVVAILAVVALVVGARGNNAGSAAGPAAQPAGPAARAARRPAVRISTIGLTLAVLLVITAVFDNVMISVGLVGYDESRISGAFVGVAPLEDFAYAVAAAVGLPALWVVLGRRAGGRSGASDTVVGTANTGNTAITANLDTDGTDKEPS